MSTLLRFTLSTLFLGVGLYVQAQEQQNNRSHLTPADFEKWERITTTEISPEGHWFAYQISPIEGDGWLKLAEVGNDPDEAIKLDYADQPEFSSDGRWFAYRIGVSEEQERELREQQERVKYDLGLMNLESAEVDTFRNISGFEFSDDGKFLAMNKYAPQDAEHDGRDVILRNLETESNQVFGNVAESSFNDDGSLFAILIDAHEQLGNGVHVIDPQSTSTRVLNSEETKYRSLTWNEDGTALAFLKQTEDEDYKEPSHKIFAFTNLDSDYNKQILDPAEITEFPDDFRIVDYRSLRWSDNSEQLFFGIKEWAEVEDEENENDQDDPDAHLDPTNVEIWHWKDDPIQPQQKVQQQSLKESNFMSVWHLDEDRFVQLMDDHKHSIRLTGDQQHAVLYDPTPYMPRFRESWNDVYLVNITNGEHEKILERHESVQVSPDGQYLLYFRNNNWWTFEIDTYRHRNITEDVDTQFNDTTRVTGREFDPPWGSGQWAEQDRWVLLYDQYDVYKARPAGGDVERITDGFADEIRFRQTRPDPSVDALDPRGDIYLSMFGDRTKDRGYARVDRRNRLDTLIYDSRMINRLAVADDRDGYFYQSQTAVDSPNFYFTENESDFDDAITLTNTNTHQDEYYWADDELVSFTNDRGEELEGRLIYPADYDPDQEYPMMVYIYERRSQTKHSYSMPNRTSAYNQRRFSSEGYFVFEPDITYELRRPGLSAVESVVPAVEEVIENYQINQDQIGLNGHSWGAYQTAFIITQTDLFSSAVAGAPLTNMISMYNSIYWNTGVPDKTIFEVSQGRFPEPYWKDWDNFVENSPIFQMEETDTPLMLMFGTEDGAVDFNQGVELYNTMRRMENPFAMLVYEGENHSLARKENQLDYARRAFEWHDYYLLDEDPQDWIIDGLPYIERPEMIED